jgi:hypothetical protein
VYVPCWWETDPLVTGEYVMHAIETHSSPGRSSVVPPRKADLEAHKGDTAATPGAWYYLTCAEPPGDSVMPRAEFEAVRKYYETVPNWRWVDPGAPPPVPALSALTLREFAERRLGLRRPEISRSPVGDAVVNFGTWYWASRQSLADPLWVRAELPGVGFAQVDAHPVRMNLRSGGGVYAGCVDPPRGKEWSPASDPAATSECSLTFPEMGRYEVTADTTYDADWFGDGITGPQRGVLASRTGPAATDDVRVVEVQVVTGGGPGRLRAG